MLRQADLVRAWKVSRAYVSELVLKRGMPIGSFKTVNEATAWRERNAMRRAPVDKNRTKRQRNIPEPKIAAEPKDPEPADDSLESALRATVEVAAEAKWLVRSAMKAKDFPAIAPLLSIHTKAVEARFEAERSYREEQVRRGMLVPITEVTALFRKGFDAIITRLKRVPQTRAPQCNPQAPLVAFNILDDTVNEILREAQKVYDEHVQPAN